MDDMEDDLDILEESMSKKIAKKICLLATGGTIASVPGADGLRPGFSGADLLARAGLSGLAELTAVELLALDSTNVAPEHWITMARAVAERRESFDAILITHGTDTMAYTAAALSQMLENIDLPVVLTGSQLPIEAPGTDAVQNLRAAVFAALSGRPGVLVAFGGKIMAGAACRKLYTENLVAFHPVNVPLLGELRGSNIHWWQEAMAPKDPFHLHDRLDTRVAVLKLTPGIDGAILRALVDAGYRSIIVEGFGAGGVPTAGHSLLPTLDYAREKNVRVLGTTQCTYDGAHLDRYENGVLAMQHGMLSGGEHTTEYLYASEMVRLGENRNK